MENKNTRPQETPKEGTGGEESDEEGSNSSNSSSNNNNREGDNSSSSSSGSHNNSNDGRNPAAIPEASGAAKPERKRKRQTNSGADTAAAVTKSEQPAAAAAAAATVSNNSSNSNSNNSKKNTHQQRWEEMYRRLVEFYQTHGHANVPNRYGEDSQLGSWVSAQRRAYKAITSGAIGSAAMTLERASKLKRLGFEWEAVNPNNVSWETRYSELVAFRKKYGHANVPMRWKENVQLSNWVSKQRHDYKLLHRGTSTRLSEERMGLLAAVDFVWDVERGSSLTQQQRATVVGTPTRKRRGHKKDGTNTAGASSSSSAGVDAPSAMLSSLTGAAALASGSGTTHQEYTSGMREASMPPAAAGALAGSHSRVSQNRQAGGPGEHAGGPGLPFGNQPSSVSQQQLQNQWTSLLQMSQMSSGATTAPVTAAVHHQPQGLNHNLLLRSGLQQQQQPGNASSAPGTAAAAGLPVSVSFPTEPAAFSNIVGAAAVAPHHTTNFPNNNAGAPGGATLSPFQAAQAALGGAYSGLDLSTIATSMAAAQAQQQQQNPYQWLSNMSAMQQIPLQQQPQAGSATALPQYAFLMPPAVQHPFGAAAPAAASANLLMGLLSGGMIVPPTIAPTLNVANLAQLLAGAAGTPVGASAPAAAAGGIQNALITNNNNAQLQNMASALFSSAMAGTTPGAAGVTDPYYLAAAAASSQVPQPATPDLLAAWAAALGATAGAQPPGMVAPVGVPRAPAVQAGANNTTGAAGATESAMSAAEAARSILGSTMAVGAANSRTLLVGGTAPPAVMLNNAARRSNNVTTTPVAVTTSSTDPPDDSPDDE